MGKSRDETHDEFPDIEAQSSESNSSHDFKVVGNETYGFEEGNSDRRIGRYRLVRPIGEGGMGVVWRAIQEHPVKRDVALKLVRKDLGKDALARFEAERQAIAMMDHPNIAKILDADTTDDGAPYFVMELVKGIPLDQYCNNRKLNIEQRLRLMLPVCRAVQHAHQKAILHRDLKHSNILVGENDDVATPKVIDFGLAKALGSQKSLTDKTMFTEYGKVVGTIYYMSPEQANSNGMDIDTRSDIYSLGVVMYKLLTGKTPIQIEGEGLSVIGAMQIIRDKDPVAPSIALRKNEDCADWATDNTTLSPERHADQLKGDIDSIVLKALEKDRRSRYETANELALDIERYLNNEPVEAQPRSTTYTIRKFVQRNKGLVASLATIATLLVGGIVATSLSLMLAISATERAELNEEVAKLETEKARAAEKLRSIQLKAQLNKSAWSDLKRNNFDTAWQSLNQMRALDSDNPGWVGRYLANEMYTCKPEDTFSGGHAHYALSLDASSKGDYIVSGGADDAVCLWDARSNRRIYRRFSKDIVKCVRFSSDQSVFAVADRANMVTVFETSTGDLVREFGPFEQDASSLCFHPHQLILAIGCFGNDSNRVGRSREFAFEEKNQPADLVIADIKSGEILQRIEEHPDEITSVAFDASGDRLVSGCSDGNLRVWKFSESQGGDSSIGCELERTVIAHPGGVYNVDISVDGKLVASCGEDKVASLWNAETGELVMHFAGHSSEVLGVAISPDGKLIATSSQDNTAIIWNLGGKPIMTWRGHTGAINEICFAADGQHVITASDDQTLRRWGIEPPGTTVTYRFDDTFDDTFEIWQADFSPDKETIATASERGIVHLIGSRDGKIKKRLQHGKPVLALVWLSDGRLVTAGEGGLWFWDRLDRSGSEIKPVKKIEFPDSLLWDVSTSPNEDQIVVASSDGTARIFDAETFKEIAVLDGHEEGLASARFSPDGERILTACDDTSIGVWDTKTYEKLYSLDEHDHSVWRTVFSPTDSNLMASSAADGKILLWDLEEKQTLPVTFSGHKVAVAGLTFSNDGRSLVSASDDGTVRVWDVETGVELFVFQYSAINMMIHASFSRDGQSLVTCGVGVVDVRHASQNFVAPYLQRHALTETIDYELRVIEEATSQKELEEIVLSAARVVDNYPTWDAWEYLGVAQCRLGRFEEAIPSLQESMRLKSVTQNSPATNKPFAEGYLALAFFNNGQADQAREIKKEFELRVAENWVGDADVDRLKDKLKTTIGD